MILLFDSNKNTNYICVEFSVHEGFKHIDDFIHLSAFGCIIKDE